MEEDDTAGATNKDVTTPMLLGAHKNDYYEEEQRVSDHPPASAVTDVSTPPYTPTRGIAFTAERAAEMVVWATPHNEMGLREKQQSVKKAITAALGERCPFPIGEVVEVGPSACGTMVRKYGETMELVAFVMGLQLQGVQDYRGPFIDFMLEYLKHNMDKAPNPAAQSHVPTVSVLFCGFGRTAALSCACRHGRP